MNRIPWILTAALLSANCSNDSGSVTASPIQTALESSAADHAAALQCFAAFKTCLQSASAQSAIDACKATLQACLPSGFDVPTSDGGIDFCDDDRRDGHRRGHHRRGPRPGDVPDGGLPPFPPGGDHDGDEDHPMGPPPGAADGENPLPPPHGKGGHGLEAGGPNHCGFGGPAAKTCKDALKACLADAANDANACVQTAHTCLHDAIVANFQAMCEDRVAHCRLCSPDQTQCDALAATCAAGIPFPDNTDGGA